VFPYISLIYLLNWYQDLQWWTLPIQGVLLILGNDLAGEQVVPEPCVSLKPQLNESTESPKE